VGHGRQQTAEAAEAGLVSGVLVNEELRVQVSQLCFLPPPHRSAFATRAAPYSFSLPAVHSRCHSHLLGALVVEAAALALELRMRGLPKGSTSATRGQPTRGSEQI
jgi:hypothetical protein